MTDMAHPAPDFTLPVSGGGEVSLSALRPKKVVLYFYPKDDTPGCTTEALDFTSRIAEFEAEDTVILGISRDPLAKHEKFIAKHDLGIRLLSDEDGAVCEAYGTWVEKKNYGRTYMGIERSTFLIGSEGQILREWRKVRVKGHVDQVLDAVKQAT